jgi:hypothetical protein
VTCLDFVVSGVILKYERHVVEHDEKFGSGMFMIYGLQCLDSTGSSGVEGIWTNTQVPFSFPFD